MADSKLPYQDPTTEDQSLATQEVARAGGVGGMVHREEVVIGNAGTNAALAEVLNAAPSTEYGLVTRNIPSGTQAVSGTVTVNAGTNLNTSLLALEAGGNLAAAAASLSVLDDWDETDRAKVNLIAGQAGVTGGAGSVAANTQRTTLASDDPAVVSLAVLDDWDESDRAKVNPIVGQAGVQGASGTVSANTQRVVLATDVPLPTGSNVLGTVTVNAGTNVNTSLLALEAGGNLAAAATSLAILDDWDETDRAKVNPIVGQAGVAAGAGSVAATVQRMTLASDDPAVVSLQILDDWDESDRAKVNLVVGQAGITAAAGSVAVNTPRVTLASDDPAVVALQIIDDWDETDRAKVNPIVGQAGVQGASGTVSANTQRVVLATDVALPAGTNNIGDVDVLTVPAEGVLSSNNSSTATLGAYAVFTGTADEILIYSSATIYVYTDQPSNTNGLSIQQSSDSTNWDVTDAYTVPQTTGKTFSIQCTARYLRVVYTNGGVVQGAFRLQTVLHKMLQPTSSVRPQDGRSNENDMQETIAYLSAFNGSSWDRLRVTPNYGLDVNVAQVENGAVTDVLTAMLNELRDMKELLLSIVE